MSYHILVWYKSWSSCDNTSHKESWREDIFELSQLALCFTFKIFDVYYWLLKHSTQRSSHGSGCIFVLCLDWTHHKKPDSYWNICLFIMCLTFKVLILLAILKAPLIIVPNKFWLILALLGCFWDDFVLIETSIVMFYYFWKLKQSRTIIIGEIVQIKSCQCKTEAT